MNWMPAVDPARLVDCSEPTGVAPVTQATLAGTAGTTAVTSKVAGYVERSIESISSSSGDVTCAASTVTLVGVPVASTSQPMKASTPTVSSACVNWVNGPVSSTMPPLGSRTNAFSIPSAPGQVGQTSNTL